MLRPKLRLLRFDCFDQQGGQSGVVHALNLVSLGIAGYHFRNDFSDILSDHAYFMLTIKLAIIGDALELSDLFQRSLQRLDICLEYSGTARRPSVRQSCAADLDF